MKSVEMNDINMLIRDYDFDNDPEKIVQYLYDQMQSERGITALKKGDQHLRDNIDIMRRFVLEIDTEIHSSCIMIRGIYVGDSDKYYLFSMVTSERYRGKGVSGVLMDYATVWGREQGARQILLSTYESNHRAIAFYEKMGFKKYGCLPMGIPNAGKLEDEIFLYLDLEM